MRSKKQQEYKEPTAGPSDRPIVAAALVEEWEALVASSNQPDRHNYETGDPIPLDKLVGT